jgi:hypothetical protein
MSELIRYLVEQFDKECRNIEEDLALGTVKEIGDYKFACGRYRGLLTAKGILMDAAQRMEHDDD